MAGSHDSLQTTHLNPPVPMNFKSGDKKPNKHKHFLFGIVLGTGGGQICLCVTFFFGKRGDRNKTPRISQENAGTVPGQSWDSPGTVPGKICFMRFLVYCLFWAPIKQQHE